MFANNYAPFFVNPARAILSRLQRDRRFTNPMNLHHQIKISCDYCKPSQIVFVEVYPWPSNQITYRWLKYHIVNMMLVSSSPLTSWFLFLFMIFCMFVSRPIGMFSITLSCFLWLLSSWHLFPPCYHAQYNSDYPAISKQHYSGTHVITYVLYENPDLFLHVLVVIGFSNR